MVSTICDTVNFSYHCFGDRYNKITTVGIVEDSHALSMACKQSLTSLLRLLYAYREEADYSVLSHINTVCKSCITNLILNIDLNII